MVVFTNIDHIYLQFCAGQAGLSLDRPIDDLHCLEELIVMLLGSDNLNTERRI
jgi:hypothetical protein